MHFRLKLFANCLLLSILTTVFSLTAVTEPPLLATKKGQLFAIEETLHILDIYYHPALTYKQKLYGVTLEKLRSKYTRMVEEAITVDEESGLVPRAERETLSEEQARHLLIALNAEFNDGHAQAAAQKNSFSTVGLRTVAIQGELFVVGIDEEHIDIVSEEAKLDFTKDQVIKIDGRSIDYFDRRNRPNISNGTIEARQDESQERILEVPHAILPPLYNDGDVVKITFRRGNKTFTNEYRWRYLDDIYLTRPISPSTQVPQKKRFQQDTGEHYYGEKGAVRSYFYEGLQKLIEDQQNSPGSSQLQIQDVGSFINKRISESLGKFLLNVSNSLVNGPPGNPDAEFMRENFDNVAMTMRKMAPVNRLQAYVVRGTEKPVAVIRIPSFSPGDFVDVFHEIAWIQNALQIFNTDPEIDTLVIDMLSNPGGSVKYAQMFLSLFASKNNPLKGLQARFSLSQEIYNGIFLSNDPTKKEDEVDLVARRKLLEFLAKQSAEGEKVSPEMGFGLSFPVTMDESSGLITSENEKASWDKKLGVLLDGKSASAAEITSAILQDNKLAWIMGEKSMGLGNPLTTNITALPIPQIRIRCPFAMCYRLNGLAIENVGVLPNIIRNIISADLLDSFRTYASDVMYAALGKSNNVETDKVNEILQKRVSRRILAPFGRKKPKALKDAQQATRALKQTIKTLPEDIESNLNDWLAAYNDFFVTLQKIEASGNMPAEAWKSVSIPLPKQLQQMDLIINTSNRKDVIIERLDEMLELDWVQSKPQTKLFLKALRKYAISVQGLYKFDESCSALFEKPAA